jgi:ketosteroid isomerase-like protein
MDAAEKEIRALVDAETAAWNARDAGALAALFHPDTVCPGHRTPQLTTRCNGSCHWGDTIGSAGFGHGRSSLTRTTWFITGDGHCAWWCLNRAMADSLSSTLTRCGAAERRRSRFTGKVALVRCTRRLTGVGCFCSRPVYSSTSAGPTTVGFREKHGTGPTGSSWPLFGRIEARVQ